MIPSGKLTAKAPETLGLVQMSFLLGFRSPASCELLAFRGSVTKKISTTPRDPGLPFENGFMDPNTFLRR